VVDQDNSYYNWLFSLCSHNQSVLLCIDILERIAALKQVQTLYWFDLDIFISLKAPVPSYESRITTSKLLIELENYEVIILTSLVNALLIVFLVFLMFIPTVTLALSLEHWYSPEAMTADTCIGPGCFLTQGILVYCLKSYLKLFNMF